MKHRIKSVDRLIGNSGLHLARVALYRGVAQCWLQGLSQLLVVVDWSDLSLDQRWQLLRACVVVERRSVTLYEEVHPQQLLADAMAGLCSQRMRIEQSFRDTKNLRVGLGLDVARSRSKQRLGMLLLIAHLTSFV